MANNTREKLVVIAFLLTLAVGHQIAVDSLRISNDRCSDLRSVQVSLLNPYKNCYYGGHVEIHIGENCR